MNKTIYALILSAGLASFASVQAYELATHSYMTYRAFTRSQLADPQGNVQKRLGLDRLDTRRAPFDYDLPFTSTAHLYLDEQAVTPPTLPVYKSRPTQDFERREGFLDLVQPSFYPSPVPAPAADPIYFASYADPSVRFEQTLILLPLDGHPVKRFTIANRGAWHGNKEDGRTEGAARPLQRGVQAASAAEGGEGRGASGGAGAGAGAGAAIRVAIQGAAARSERGSAAAAAVGTGSAAA